MRVAAMGGGVVGVTAAYELLKDGHEVVLLEQNNEVGDETSWGNAGMIAPGHSFAWSSPQAPWSLVKSLIARNQASRVIAHAPAGRVLSVGAYGAMVWRMVWNGEALVRRAVSTAVRTAAS